MSWGSPQGRPRGWRPSYGNGNSPHWGTPQQGFRQNFGGQRQPRPPYGGWGSFVEDYGGNYSAAPYMTGSPRMPHPPLPNKPSENAEQTEGEPPVPGSEPQNVSAAFSIQGGPPLPPQPPSTPPQWSNSMAYPVPGVNRVQSGFNPYPSQLLQGEMGGKKKKKKKNKGANVAVPPVPVARILPYKGYEDLPLHLPPPPPPPPPETIPAPPGPPPPKQESSAKASSNPTQSGPPSNQNPANWPPSLQNYVSRCYAKAKTEIDKDQVEIILKGKITKAAGTGSLWDKDWDNEPLPRTFSMDAKDKKPAQMTRGPVKFGLSPNKTLARNSLRSRSPQPPRRRRRASSDSSASSESRRSSSTSRRHRTADYGRNPNMVPLGVKGKSSPGSKFKGLKPDPPASGVSSKFQKRRLKLQPKGKNSEDVDNDGDDDDVPYFYTDGRKRMSLDADLASNEKRQKRAARFAPQSSQPNRAGTRKKSLNLMASINQTLTSGDNFEECNMEWESLHIVGTCQDLEKRFLRLTSAPEAHMVRPVTVLKQSLKMVIEKWKHKQDYHYTCDQLKSIRQDLTVQGIRDEFTIKVYETHARVALEKCDTTEFNQCQSQLRMLYHDIGGANRLEFTAYRILYYMYTKETLDLTSVMSELNDEEKKDESISHALKLRTAWSLQNYHRFFNLYKTAPKMSGYIIDWFIDRERKAALRIIIKSYRPGVPVEFLRRVLAYDDSTDDWQKFSEPFGLQFTDISRSVIDCKNSMACLPAIA